MTVHTITIETEKSLPAAAREFIGIIGSRKLVAFRGEMGAGKTTFISALCHELGVGDDASSPSFSIANEYAAADGSLIYHFDFYRLESPEEALDIGIEDYFCSGALCLMEWPERIGTLLPDDAVEAELTADPISGARTLIVKLP